MTVYRWPICLYREFVCDLQQAIVQAHDVNCPILITSIVSPQYDCRNFENVPHNVKFTRPDLLLSPSRWERQIIAKLTESINCDSLDENFRKHSESILKQEIGYAQYLATKGRMLIKLRNGNTSNLARLVTNELKGLI